MQILKDIKELDRPQFHTRACEKSHEEEKRRARCLWDNVFCLGGMRPGLFLLLFVLTPSVLAGSTAEERDLGRFFEGYKGCFVLLDASRDHWIRYRSELCKKRLSPCSTFKIPNSLIALETGVATGPEFSLPWDGTKHPIEAWNRDQTLRSAFSVSCAWFYQELARRIGNQRMDHWVKTIQYGNQDISGGLTNFWLSSSLSISPDEQVDFLHRLHTRRLPFSARSIDIALDLMTVSSDGEITYRGKTGTAGNRAKLIATEGWWVGSVSGPKADYYFATWITGGENPSGGTARQIAERILRDLELLPKAK